jgi:hypothetical protein
MRASVALKLPGAMQLMQVPMIAGASNMVRPFLLLSSRWPTIRESQSTIFSRARLTTGAGNAPVLEVV